MAKYKVDCLIELRSTVEVEADSPDAAEEALMDRIGNDEKLRRAIFEKWNDDEFRLEFVETTAW